jgi:hypothetical protein
MVCAWQSIEHKAKVAQATLRAEIIDIILFISHSLEILAPF